MSHELRTPLNSIIGYSEMLEEDLERAPDMASPDDVRRIRFAADHWLNLITEVLDLSAIESGNLKLSPTPVDLGTLIHDVAETVRPIGAKKGTSVETTLDGDIPILMIDGRRLKQCVLNLASNACKFTQNDQVSIRAVSTKTIQIKDLSLLLQILASGSRLSNRHDYSNPLSKSITAQRGFTKAPASALFITQKLAQAMGGDVTLSSTLGVRSLFTLSVAAALNEAHTETSS